MVGVEGVVDMRLFLLCWLAIVLGFETMGNVQTQKGLYNPAQAVQSQDTSMLKPTDVAYTDAMEFAQFLNARGFIVKSVHRSKLESFFLGIKKAAFFRTNKGVVEVIFFPEPTGAERIRVREQRRSGQYLYSFEGQPHPNPPGDTIDSGQPIYFLMHRNWFILIDSQELYDLLKRALTEG